MPNTYEATDPKTGQKWTWDGKKWNTVQDGAVSRFEKGLRTSMGFEAEGGVKQDLSQIGSGLKQIATHPIDSTKLLAEGLVGSQQQLNERGAKEMHDPSLLTKATGVGHWLESGVPMIGPMLASAGDKFSSGDVAGGMGSMTPLLVPPLAERGMPAIGEAAGRVSKAGVRDVLGIGKKDVEGHIKKVATKEEAAHTAALEKVEKAKESYAGAVSDALKKRAAASAKETAAKVKQEALASKHGPVYQRMNEMTDGVQKHIGEMEQKVNATESKKWDSFSERMDNAPVKMQGTVEAIADAQKNILTGDSLPVFRQILSEAVKDDAAEFIDTAGGLVPKGTEVPLNLARRLYTKIGRKLGGTELPRDVTRALAKVSDSLDSGIAESVATKGGADALRDYRKLQSDWKQYRQTFSDRDSPLRKIMEAKDPSTKIGPITGETGARAIDYLGRYRNMGAQPEQLGKIRALNKALKEIPSGGAKLPGMPERPSLPETPARKTTTPQQARESMLESKSSSYSRPPSKWELMFPPLLAYKQTLKHLLQSPSFRKWLATDNPSIPPP